MHTKALASAADVVMLDLEDSVPLSEKENARLTVIESLKEATEIKGSVALRINGMDTEHAWKDLVEVVGVVGEKIDSIVLPKVESVGDVHFVDRLLTGMELEGRFGSQKIFLEPSIESPLGLERASEIASASDRNISLVFGIADYTASVGARLTSISGHGEGLGESETIRWNYVLSRLVMCAKASGLKAIDAPYGNFKDSEGLRKSASSSLSVGCDGKWAIHPGQIEILNDVFSPDQEELDRIRLIVKATEKAPELGAVAIEGRMVDQATLRLARTRYSEFARLGFLDPKKDSFSQEKINT